MRANPRDRNYHRQVQHQQDNHQGQASQQHQHRQYNLSDDRQIRAIEDQFQQIPRELQPIGRLLRTILSLHFTLVDERTHYGVLGEFDGFLDEIIYPKFRTMQEDFGSVSTSLQNVILKFIEDMAKMAEKVNSDEDVRTDKIAAKVGSQLEVKKLRIEANQERRHGEMVEGMNNATESMNKATRAAEELVRSIRALHNSYSVSGLVESIGKFLASQLQQPAEKLSQDLTGSIEEKIVTKMMKEFIQQLQQPIEKVLQDLKESIEESNTKNTKMMKDFFQQEAETRKKRDEEFLQVLKDLRGQNEGGTLGKTNTFLTGTNVTSEACTNDLSYSVLDESEEEPVGNNGDNEAQNLIHTSRESEVEPFNTAAQRTDILSSLPQQDVAASTDVRSDEFKRSFTLDHYKIKRVPDEKAITLKRQKMDDLREKFKTVEDARKFIKMKEDGNKR